MKNFIDFQLSTEEAANTLGRRGRGRRGGLRKLLKGLTEEQRTAVREGLQELRDSEGWEDLSRQERREAKKGLIESIVGEE